MLNAVIIDDEAIAIKLLVELLTKRTSLKVKIVGTALNLNDGIEIIRKTQPDIVFLDIKMPGKTGLEIYNSIKLPDFKIIFCTAYPNYAIDVLKNDSYGYILKPIDIAELNKVLHKVNNVFLEEQKQLQFEDKFDILSNPVFSGTHIVLETGYGFYATNTRNIEYFYVKDSITFAVMHSQKEILIKKSLKELNYILTEKQFSRTNRFTLVNVNYIHKYFSTKNENYIVMESGIKIPVSIKLNADFTKEIKQKMNL
jgi:two-component system LytT family response regulator